MKAVDKCDELYLYIPERRDELHCIRRGIKEEITAFDINKRRCMVFIRDFQNSYTTSRDMMFDVFMSHAITH